MLKNIIEINDLEKKIATNDFGSSCSKKEIETFLKNNRTSSNFYLTDLPKESGEHNANPDASKYPKITENDDDFNSNNLHSPSIEKERFGIGNDSRNNDFSMSIPKKYHNSVNKTSICISNNQSNYFDISTKLLKLDDYTINPTDELKQLSASIHAYKLNNNIFNLSN